MNSKVLFQPVENVWLRPFAGHDQSLLSSWLRTPAVRRWFPDWRVDLELARAPRFGMDQLIVMLGNAAVGYLRWERKTRQDLNAVALWNIPANSVDIDILLGSDACRGLGVGPSALLCLEAYLGKTLPNTPLLGLTTSQRNAGAHRAFEKAGYVRDQQMQLPLFGPCWLYTKPLDRTGRN